MNLKRQGRQISVTKGDLFWHIIKSVCGRVIYRHSIKRNKDSRILVILHLYYMDLWPSIKRYLDNLSSYQYDLVVTYVTGHYDLETLNDVCIYKKNVRLVEYENKGFDIGGFIDVLSSTKLDDYDIIFKLQSKGVGRDFIYVYDQVFKKADWFLNLFDGILGEFSLHRAINRLTQNSKIGIVASANLIVQDPPHKRYFTSVKASSLGIPIHELYHYVAGSCFAIKASLLSCIQKLHLNIDNFEPTKRGTFSLAHVMERLICACVEPQGYTISGISVPHPLYIIEKRYHRSISALRLLEDDRFIVDYDFFYKAMEMFPVFSYEIKPIKLGDLRRYWKDNLYFLKDCSPYAYIQGNVERYEQYIIANSEESDFRMSRERFDNLINSLEENGPDPKQLPIICAQDNTIWDGLHRSCWLLSKYGEEHIIPVVYLHAPVWYKPINPSSINSIYYISKFAKIRRALFCKAARPFSW